MDKKIALLIIYNHRFDKNIPVLEEIFRGKFSHIYHIVPFYDCDKENVLPVYESSYYFSGYIAQALSQIKEKSFTHYVFTSDDLMLNPAINENNIHSMIGLNDDDSYIPRYRSLKDPQWARSLDALGYKMDGLGAEVAKILPSKEEACDIFRKHELDDCDGVTSSIAWKIAWHQINNHYNRYLPVTFNLQVIKNLFRHPFSYYFYNYPMIGGYNDFFIIPAKSIDNFSEFCGAFAASKLFVEVALPTAMVLSSSTIKTSSNTRLRCGDLWLDDIKRLEEKYDHSLKRLFEDFPEDLLYCHPVKLSKWK